MPKGRGSPSWRWPWTGEVSERSRTHGSTPGFPCTHLNPRISPIPGNPGYAVSVLPQHQELLADSAISPEVARARGYVSADSKKQLERYGFASYQQRAPGLLIVLRLADGSVWGYQLRPDT